MTAKYGGVMVFAPDGNCPAGGSPTFANPDAAAAYYTAIAQGEYGPSATVTYAH